MINLYSYHLTYFDELDHDWPILTQGIVGATDYTEATKILRDYYGNLGDLYLCEFDNVAEFPKSVVTAFEKDTYSFNERNEKVTH